MKLFLPVITTAILSALLQLYLPWWSLAVAAAVTGAIFSARGLQSFLNGFLGTALVWWSYAWMIDFRNESILSTRVAGLFQLDNTSLLILVCGLIAGIVGGFASLSGSELRKLSA